VYITQEKHMKVINAKVNMESHASAESKADVRLSVILSPELNETLDGLAQRSSSTKSEILRKALALFDVAAEAKQRNQKIGILDQDDKVVKEIVGI
jgi:predicted transcriptional regulator